MYLKTHTIRKKLIINNDGIAHLNLDFPDL